MGETQQIYSLRRVNLSPRHSRRLLLSTLRQSKNLAYNYRSINCKLSEGPSGSYGLPAEKMLFHNRPMDFYSNVML